MVNHRKLFAWVLGIIAVLMIGIYIYNLGRKQAVVREVKIIEVQVDTIEKRIKGDEKIVTKYVDKIKQIERTKIIYDTVACKEIVAQKDSIITYKDSIIGRKDTIIKRKDSIIYLDREIIKWKDKQPEFKKRWGLGLQGGYGVSRGDQLSPFFGVGISYNLLTF